MTTKRSALFPFLRQARACRRDGKSADRKRPELPTTSTSLALPPSTHSRFGALPSSLMRMFCLFLLSKKAREVPLKIFMHAPQGRWILELGAAGYHRRSHSGVQPQPNSARQVARRFSI
jgi:hypothetical protein